MLSPTPPPASLSAPDTRPSVAFATAQGDAVVRVEVVQSQAKVERGLMYREHLPPDDGMLFLLTPEQDWKFWMRNTLIGLDIIFIKRDMTIAGIAANAKPRDESLLSVGVPSVYVVEVNAGWCAAHHVVAGNVAKFAGVEGAAH
jgi:uncharacterized membrane protein (UPF0127 family)